MLLFSALKDMASHTLFSRVIRPRFKDWLREHEGPAKDDLQSEFEAIPRGFHLKQFLLHKVEDGYGELTSLNTDAAGRLVLSVRTPAHGAKHPFPHVRN